MTEEDKAILLKIAAIEWKAKTRRIKKSGMQLTRRQSIALLEAAKHVFLAGHWLGFRDGQSEERTQSFAKALEILRLPSN